MGNELPRHIALPWDSPSDELLNHDAAQATGRHQCTSHSNNMTATFDILQRACSRARDTRSFTSGTPSSSRGIPRARVPRPNVVRGISKPTDGLIRIDDVVVQNTVLDRV